MPNITNSSISALRASWFSSISYSVEVWFKEGKTSKLAIRFNEITKLAMVVL